MTCVEADTEGLLACTAKASLTTRNKVRIAIDQRSCFFVANSYRQLCSLLQKLDVT